jgi:DNA processing protein
VTGRPRFDVDDERLARAAWSRLAEPGDGDAYRVVARFGPVRSLRAVVDGQAGAARWQVRLPDLDPVRDLATLRRFGGRLVIPSDPEWPSTLADLGEGSPFCLWVRGPLDLGEVTQRSVSVVGSRAATGYGEHVAVEIGTGCAEQGLCVVSGAAYGIDGASHRGALAVPGATVAVLACGVDRAYPRGNERLIARIAADGVVASEIPPGSSPTRRRFIERNRLIAALSQVSVVVEAAWRSGALITARHADRLGRIVGAVPGPVTSPTSAGSHRLIREGIAVCVTDAAEVIELASPIGEGLPEPPVVATEDHDGLRPSDQRVLDALPLGRAVPIASLARVAGLEEPLVEAAVGRLELLRLAVRGTGGWRRGRPPDREGR